jgi:hypothetical protein
MATLAEPAVGKPAGLAEVIDRWIYVFMAVLFIVTVLTGFIPDSIGLLAAVDAGKRPPLPAILHVHAALMGSWLLLLLTQSILMATNRPALHKQLGMISFGLAPILFIVGILLVPAMRVPLAEAFKAASPELAPQLRQALHITMNIVLLQMRIGIGFAGLYAIGILVRKTDFELHKRLMILATAAPMPAAIDRMEWLPSTMPGGILSVDIGMLAIISPMLLWDLYRLKKVHKAYIIWFLVNLPMVIFGHIAWGTAWWEQTAFRMLGITGV